MPKKTMSIAILILTVISTPPSQASDMKPSEKPWTPEQRKKWDDQNRAIWAFRIDDIWAALSLGVELPRDKHQMLRSIMKDAWAKRRESLTQASEQDTWKQANTKMKANEKALDKQLKTLLSKDEHKQYKRVLKQNRRWLQTLRKPVQKAVMDNKIRAFETLPVHEMWTTLSLGLKLSEDKYQTLRVVMTESWRTRQSLLEHANKYGSWKEVKEELQDLEEILDAKIESIIDSKEQKLFNDLLAQTKRLKQPDLE